jgi:hypothetical protein
MPPAEPIVPTRLPEAVIEEPKIMLEDDSETYRASVPGFTARNWHGLVAPLLLASPLYTAFQLYDPAVTKY